MTRRRRRASFLRNRRQPASNGYLIETRRLDAAWPNVIYRSFHCSEYADAFVHGKVFISTLGACRRYETLGQGDPGEGTAHYESGFMRGHGDDPVFRQRAARYGVGMNPGARNITFDNCASDTTIPDAYVLCCTVAPSDVVGRVFGAFCVEITDPPELFRRLTIALGRRHHLRQAVWGRVRYADRSYHGLEPESGPTGFVKPADPYAPQKEFRMLWFLNDHAPVIAPTLVSVGDLGGVCRRAS